MITTLSAPGSTDDESYTNRNINSHSERRCENMECNAFKLLSMVPKRKPASQFITEPVVMEKPLIVDGFTTAFQVGGTTAKWNHIKNMPNNVSPKTVYRIIPNTHVHVINYVVVDRDGINFHKIQNHEPHTMQKLLSSQKESAEQMLKKLMTAHGTTAYVKPTTLSPVAKVTTFSNLKIGQSTSANMTTDTAINQMSSTTTTSNDSIPVSLPSPVHPNLKITAVVGAESVNHLNNRTSSAKVTSLEAGAPSALLTPYITAVPLANLQNPAISTDVLDACELPVQSYGSSTDLVIPTQSMDAATHLDKPGFDKMQAEIQELRRTVAMLTDVQAKNQQHKTINTQRAAKRPRNCSTGK